jgi:hypothetical protein
MCLNATVSPRVFAVSSPWPQEFSLSWIRARSSSFGGVVQISIRNDRYQTYYFSSCFLLQNIIILWQCKGFFCRSGRGTINVFHTGWWDLIIFAISKLTLDTTVLYFIVVVRSTLLFFCKLLRKILATDSLFSFLRVINHITDLPSLSYK